MSSPKTFDLTDKVTSNRSRSSDSKGFDWPIFFAGVGIVVTGGVFVGIAWRLFA